MLGQSSCFAMNNKKLIWLILLAVGLIAYLWWMLSSWGTWKEKNELGMQFIALMGFTLVAGILFVTLVLPAIGERIGEFFYSAPGESEPDEYSKAAAKVSQGDYEGAIEAYREIANEEPENRFPVIEISKIQQEQLGDVDAAIKTLETSIDGRDWAEDDAAFLMFRLYDLQANDKGDYVRAKELLSKVIESLPNTRHSANATHKLKELESTS